MRLVDCMPLKGHGRTVVRMVEGLSGEVQMRMELVVRFDYGSTIPWVQSSRPRRPRLSPGPTRSTSGPRPRRTART